LEKYVLLLKVSEKSQNYIKLSLES